MKAARWHARGDIRIDDVPVPVPDSGEALVRVLWCGICGTDLEEYRSGPLTIPAGKAPLTLGHEIVGVVERPAADGTGPAAGTVVVPDVVSGCGQCWWCARHEEGLCPRLAVTGQHRDGGLAEYVVARAARCLPVPAGLPPDRAALAEPASVAVRAVRKAGCLLGQQVGVLGGGTIGQLVAQVARAAGAADVVVVDPVRERRDLAIRLASASACRPDELDARLAGLAAPGLDVLFECTGAPGLLSQAIRVVRPGGIVVAVGLHAGAEPVPLAELVLAEKRVIGSAAHMWDTDVAGAIRMLETGAIDGGPLITHRVPLANLVSDALESDVTAALKIVIDCR